MIFDAPDVTRAAIETHEHPPAPTPFARALALFTVAFIIGTFVANASFVIAGRALPECTPIDLRFVRR